MYLESPSEKGKFLSVDIAGDISYNHQGDRSVDQLWDLIGNTDKGSFLVSRNFRMALDYDPTSSNGEKIIGKYFNPEIQTHTLWNFTKNNEIYTIDRAGDKRYLWNLAGEFFVTPDEHIAEHWTPIELEGYDIGEGYAQDKIDLEYEAHKKANKNVLIITIWFLIFCVTLFWIFMKRRNDF